MKNNSKKQRFRRGIYVLPTLFTIGTIFCGFFAVTNALKGEFNLAAIAIGFAVVFDGLDGRIARMTNTCSEFGVQIDSLADVVTFGLAPAILAFLWGARAVPVESTYSLHLQQLGWIVCFGFLVCGAMRLARYNIQSAKPPPSGSGSEKPFVGMPIPAGAALIAAAVHFSPEPPEHWIAGILWNLLVGFLGFLMVQHSEISQFQACRSEEPPAIRQFRAPGHAGSAHLLLLAGRPASHGRRICVLGIGVEGLRPGQAQTGRRPDGRQAQAG